MTPYRVVIPDTPCAIHHQSEATLACIRCGRFLCSECVGRRRGGRVRCSRCTRLRVLVVVGLGALLGAASVRTVLAAMPVEERTGTETLADRELDAAAKCELESIRSVTSDPPRLLPIWRANHCAETPEMLEALYESLNDRGRDTEAVAELERLALVDAERAARIYRLRGTRAMGDGGYHSAFQELGKALLLASSPTLEDAKRYIGAGILAQEACWATPTLAQAFRNAAPGVRIEAELWIQRYASTYDCGVPAGGRYLRAPAAKP
jgi:hypothetical protein